MVHAVAGRPAEEQLTARILVVDDEPGMRKSLAIMLRRERYDVTETSSVADAVGCLKRDAFHLVIADLMMEPLQAPHLLQRVRELVESHER